MKNFRTYLNSDERIFCIKGIQEVNIVTDEEGNKFDLFGNYSPKSEGYFQLHLSKYSNEDRKCYECIKFIEESSSKESNL